MFSASIIFYCPLELKHELGMHISNLLVLLLTGFTSVLSSSAGVNLRHRCPITNTTNMIYSVVNGVGPASKIWVEDMLWWE